jgi:hypothetical protein
MKGERLKGAGIPLLVLVVVVIWWIWFVPRTSQFKAYKRKTEMKAILVIVEPPRGVHILSTDAREVQPGMWLALGTFSGFTKCDDVIAHYKEQFPKHGLTLAEEGQYPQTNEKHARFIGPDYQAFVSCLGQELPQPYKIWIVPKDQRVEVPR